MDASTRPEDASTRAMCPHLRPLRFCPVIPPPMPRLKLLPLASGCSAPSFCTPPSAWSPRAMSRSTRSHSPDRLLHRRPVRLLPPPAARVPTHAVAVRGAEPEAAPHHLSLRRPRAHAPRPPGASEPHTPEGGWEGGATEVFIAVYGWLQVVLLILLPFLLFWVSSAQHIKLKGRLDTVGMVKEGWRPLVRTLRDSGPADGPPLLLRPHGARDRQGAIRRSGRRARAHRPVDVLGARLRSVLARAHHLAAALGVAVRQLRLLLAALPARPCVGVREERRCALSRDCFRRHVDARGRVRALHGRPGAGSALPQTCSM